MWRDSALEAKTAFLDQNFARTEQQSSRNGAFNQITVVLKHQQRCASNRRCLTGPAIYLLLFVFVFHCNVT